MSKKKKGKKERNVERPVIELGKVCKNFDNSRVLTNIDLAVRDKDFITVMGQSGSGKSTLLYIMSGLEKPTDGKVIISGKELSTLNDRELSKIRCQDIGFVFQFYNLMQNLTVRENILLPAQVMGKTYTQLKVLYEEVIELVELKDQQSRLPSQLSGGQQQRIAIARALINSPRVILADELTGNLDCKTTEKVMNILRDINRKMGVTIVHVSHNPDLVEYGSRKIVLKDGKIEQDLILQGSRIKVKEVD